MESVKSIKCSYYDCERTFSSYSEILSHIADYHLLGKSDAYTTDNNTIASDSACCAPTTLENVWDEFEETMKYLPESETELPIQMEEDITSCNYVSMEIATEYPDEFQHSIEEAVESPSLTLLEPLTWKEVDDDTNNNYEPAVSMEIVAPPKAISYVTVSSSKPLSRILPFPPQVENACTMFDVWSSKFPLRSKLKDVSNLTLNDLLDDDTTNKSTRSTTTVSNISTNEITLKEMLRTSPGTGTKNRKKYIRKKKNFQKENIPPINNSKPEQGADPMNQIVPFDTSAETQVVARIEPPPVYFSYEYIIERGLKGRKNGGKNTDNIPFYCPVPGCEKVYKNANGLKYHARYGHSPPQTFACKECSKVYTTNHGLRAHVKLHTARTVNVGTNVDIARYLLADEVMRDSSNSNTLDNDVEDIRTFGSELELQSRQCLKSPTKVFPTGKGDRGFDLATRPFQGLSVKKEKDVEDEVEKKPMPIQYFFPVVASPQKQPRFVR